MVIRFVAQLHREIGYGRSLTERFESVREVALKTDNDLGGLEKLGDHDNSEMEEYELRSDYVPRSRRSESVQPRRPKLKSQFGRAAADR